MKANETLDALADCLKAIGLRVFVLGEDVDVPASGCVVLGPPRLEWNHPGNDPSDASFNVVCVATKNDRLVATMLSLVSNVSQALAASPSDWSLSGADLGTFPNGATNLPAYIIEIEAALT